LGVASPDKKQTQKGLLLTAMRLLVCFCWELGLSSKPTQEANSKGSLLDRNEATGMLLLGARVG